MLGQPQALRDDEHEHRASRAEQLEIDPRVGREPIRDKQIGDAQRREEQRPRNVELVPDRRWQLDLRAHCLLNQIFAQHELREQHGQRERPIQHGRLPFDERVVMQHERRATEHGHDGQAHPQHRIDAPVAKCRPCDLHQHGSDCHSGCNIDVPDFECNEEKRDRQ
ncbi:hypothetical protein DFQ28_010046 [Apophysomyces sp. BC1034]|nr:hypothetical protein DFQ30_010582 [Apophysomyces sp. BC1015]KAG0192165.1 hypothetical protein DFQ28_010046 [Apophysomyces sp. BC1034]